MSMLSPQTSLPNIWLPIVVDRIAQFLDDNEVACTLRLLDKSTAEQFKHRIHVRLSGPVPHHAFRHHWSKPESTSSLNCSLRANLVALTASSGCLPNLELALQHAGIDLTAHPYAHANNLLAAAAAAGHIHICEWLHQRGCPVHVLQLLAAAQSGRQETCAWLLDHGCDWRLDAVQAAARGGHPDLVKWLLSIEPLTGHVTTVDELFMDAVEGCDLATCQLLHGGEFLEDPRLSGCVSGRSPRPKPCAPYVARLLGISVGSPTADWQSKVVWLEGLLSGCLPAGTDCRRQVCCKKAVSCRDAVDRFTWLTARGYRVRAADMVFPAAAEGNIAALQWLLNREAVVHYGALNDHTAARYLEMAACAGHLSCLQLLHAHGWLIGGPLPLLKYSVLLGGHLSVVWVGLAGGEWVLTEMAAGSSSHHFLNWACESGNLELVAWLHERRCRAGPELYACSARNGCQDVLKWLAAHGVPFPTCGQPYKYAAANGDLATLACLRQLGCPSWPGVHIFVLQEFPLGVCAWLDSAGFRYEALVSG